MLKLSKDAKRVLRFFQKTPPNCQGQFFDVTTLNTDTVKMGYCTFIAMVDRLLDLGALKSHKGSLVVSLTDLGMHAFEYQWLDVKEFLFQSIIVPIGVAALTSIITVFISATR